MAVADDVAAMAGAITELREQWSRGALDASFDLMEFGKRFLRAVERALDGAHA